MVFAAVQVLPVGSKPPVAVIVRIFKGKRHDLGAAAPFSTTTLSLQGRTGGLVLAPKLVELVFGPGSIRLAESYPRASFVLLWRRPPCTRESSCLLARLLPWQDVASERPALGLLHADHRSQILRVFWLLFKVFVESLVHRFRHYSTEILQCSTYPHVGNRDIAPGTAMLSFRAILG